MPCTTASTVLSVLQEKVRQLEVRHCEVMYDGFQLQLAKELCLFQQCHQQHAGRGNMKVKCGSVVGFIDGLKGMHIA